MPSVPTHIAIATPPKGTQIAIGIVEAQNFGGKGGGTQFYSMQEARDNWFKFGEKIQ